MKNLKRKREKRKPKGFKSGSVKGKEQAIISDAIKKCKEDGIAYFTLHKQRLKIKPPTILDNPPCGHLGKFLVRSKWGVQVRDVIFDGNRNYYEYTRENPVSGRQYGRRYFEDTDLLAEIVPIQEEE